MPCPQSISPLPLTIPRQTDTVFQPPFRLPSPHAVLTPVTTTEIHREPLNGTRFLSAFYDSKCYRCNICKFKSPTSSVILQHMFTHMFFCPHCPFYTYAHHSLYQHVQERHLLNLYNDTIDPKNVDLLYITRCSDGTFALCMDTSSPAAPKPDEQDPPAPLASKAKRRAPKRRNPKPKKADDNDIVIVPAGENRTVERSARTTTLAKRRKEEPAPDFVFMKHRRCYTLRSPSCLHPLTLEYNICRELTIRQMCHTQGIFKRRNLKAKHTISSILEEVATCLKTVVNALVNKEEDRNSRTLLCALPHCIINLIFPTDNLNVLMNVLRLNNKHDTHAKYNERTRSEYAVRTSKQHTFVLSSTEVSRNEQSLWLPLQGSVTSTDSFYTRTNTENLIGSYGNARRFLKSTRRQPTTQSFKQNINTVETLKLTTNSGAAPISPSGRRQDRPSLALQVDGNNNPITSSESNASATSSVIVID